MSEHGRRVLVTGATSGLGYAIVRKLLENGDRVVGAGRTQSVLEALTLEFSGKFHGVTCDLHRSEEREQLFDLASSHWEGLDDLVCAAGLFIHEEFGSIKTDSMEAQLDVNFRSPLRLCEQGVSGLSDGGSILFLSSTLANRPITTSAVYTATKAAIDAVVKVAAQTGAARGIRVNSLALGVVDTPMARQDRPDGLDEESRMEFLVGLHPLGRLGEASEVATVALSILRQEWTTGTVMTMDGGLSCQP